MVGTIGHKVLAGQKKIELDTKTTVGHSCVVTTVDELWGPKSISISPTAFSFLHTIFFNHFHEFI